MPHPVSKSCPEFLAGLLLAMLLSPWAAAAPPVHQARLLGSFDAPAARQGVAVDATHFYAVTNTGISRHDKVTGAADRQWDASDQDQGLLIHLDSGMVQEGSLYAAHSNYPHSPMTSSVEIWDTATMTHTGSHSFGVRLGSLTWVDFHDGHWWGTFGNYDKVQAGQSEPYGRTANTTLVKMNSDFLILEQWQFPAALLERFSPMSNSGGSWGPDGHLYITGHDHPEIYVLDLPEYGSRLQWIATVEVQGLQGQGIAWDRSSEERILWGINRAGPQVLRFSVPAVDGQPD